MLSETKFFRFLIVQLTLFMFVSSPTMAVVDLGEGFQTVSWLGQRNNQDVPGFFDQGVHSPPSGWATELAYQKTSAGISQSTQRALPHEQ